MIEWFFNWIEEIRVTYGVNPYIFAGIYLGAVPFFWAGVYWLVRNLKIGKPAAGPILLMCSCAVSSYVYLLLVGQNIPVWVYVLIVLMLIYGIYAAFKKILEKKREVAHEKGL